MCGRFARPMPRAVLEEHFGVAFPENVEPDWNIAPGLPVPVVYGAKKRSVVSPVWGFVPSWADQNKAKPVINARSETLWEKPSFKNAAIKGRCLFPAGAYYEWKRGFSGEKTPFAVRMKNSEVFALAGIMEEGCHPSFVCRRPTSAVITCEPNSLIRSVHNRMPVIITPENYDVWLDPSTPADKIDLLMQALPSTLFETFQVCCKVNSNRNNGPELLMKAVIRPSLLD
ncbi:SOS response-associated peptidase [Maridesulfovibrio bastinii]|uniref:SOS response-associated peptidase n=1 Tax=Maridesulfovibrio bastinii TaxID=47157 RepID=UPI00040F7FA6|nr:SOS response-associated peptidase [Maridesulfovibrio bastinii]